MRPPQRTARHYTADASPQNSTAAFLSRHVTRPRLFDSSALFFPGSLYPALRQNSVSPPDFQPLQIIPSANTSSAPLSQKNFRPDPDCELGVSSLQKNGWHHIPSQQAKVAWNSCENALEEKTEAGRALVSHRGALDRQGLELKAEKVSLRVLNRELIQEAFSALHKKSGKKPDRLSTTIPNRMLGISLRVDQRFAS